MLITDHDTLGDFSAKKAELFISNDFNQEERITIQLADRIYVVVCYHYRNVAIYLSVADGYKLVITHHPRSPVAYYREDNTDRYRLVALTKEKFTDLVIEAYPLYFEWLLWHPEVME